MRSCHRRHQVRKGVGLVMVREGINKGHLREVAGIKVVVVVTRAVGEGEEGMVVVEGIKVAGGGGMITIGLGVMAVEEATVGVGVGVIEIGGDEEVGAGIRVAAAVEVVEVVVEGGVEGTRGNEAQNGMQVDR